MDNVNLVVAENLKNIRIGKGWSQSFVANQLGIAQRTISRAECGCGCSDRTLRLLANMYQVHISSLYEIKKADEKKYLDIVPVNVIAYRSQYGSVSPSGILLAGIIATTCSTVAGTIFALAAGRAG